MTGRMELKDWRARSESTEAEITRLRAANAALKERVEWLERPVTEPEVFAGWEAGRYAKPGRMCRAILTAALKIRMEPQNDTP